MVIRSKFAFYSHLFSTFNQSYDLQTTCVKSISQRSRSWDRIKRASTLFWEGGILSMRDKRRRKRIGQGKLSEWGCWYDTCERKEDKEGWAGRAQTMIQFRLSLGQPIREQQSREDPLEESLGVNGHSVSLQWSLSGRNFPERMWPWLVCCGRSWRSSHCRFSF